jgi:hypothetical protein
MSIPTTEQEKINQAQAELNKRRNDAQAKALADQHALGKAVQEQLAGIPMHGTNVPEVAMVCAAVLALKEYRNDPGKPAQPAATSQR